MRNGIVKENKVCLEEWCILGVRGWGMLGEIKHAQRLTITTHRSFV